MNLSYDLFLLMLNLSQMSDKRKVIMLFHESMTELFQPQRFFYSEQNIAGSIYSEEISTRNFFYGYLISNSEPAGEIRQLVQNAIQMLAVVLDRLSFEEGLKGKVVSLETEAQQQLSQINSYVDELEIARLASLNLIDDLKEEIVERKRTEEALQESKEKYRLLHEAAGVGIGYYTPEGTVISYNAIAAKNMSGIPEDFAGKSIFDLFPKPDAERYLERINRAAISPIPQLYEDNVVLPSGTLWFNSVFCRIVDSDNKIAGIQIISTDITERKKAEEEVKNQLNELSRWYEAMIDREDRILELKKEVNILHDRLGLPLIYKSAQSDNNTLTENNPSES